MALRHLGLENPIFRLPHAADAAFNSFAKQHESTCLRNTRVDLLDEIQAWADGSGGLAGTGKSTIARTVARRYRDRQRLAASFFFSRGGGNDDREAPGLERKTLFFPLMFRDPVLYSHLGEPEKMSSACIVGLVLEAVSGYEGTYKRLGSFYHPWREYRSDKERKEFTEFDDFDPDDFERQIVTII